MRRIVALGFGLLAVLCTGGARAEGWDGDSRRGGYERGYDRGYDRGGDHDRGRGREWRERRERNEWRERQERRNYDRHERYGYSRPPAYYPVAPGPYAPPVYAPPGFNLVIPFR